MDPTVLLIAALAAPAPSTLSTVGSAGGSASSYAGGPVVQRSSGAAIATATISARIIRYPAEIGPGRAPPLPGMAPRRATVTTADGRPVDALIYDFE